MSKYAVVMECQLVADGKPVFFCAGDGDKEPVILSYDHDKARVYTEQEAQQVCNALQEMFDLAVTYLLDEAELDNFATLHYGEVNGEA